MRRFQTFAAVFGCVAMLQLAGAAQSTEQKTKIKTEHGKMVTYTGCIQNEGETHSYILDKVAPISKSETIGTSGDVTTITKYALIPEEKVELDEHVGHRVQVTGVVIEPGHGHAKIEEKTETHGEPDQKVKTEIDRGSVPQLRVVSVRPLPGSC